MTKLTKLLLLLGFLTFSSTGQTDELSDFFNKPADAASYQTVLQMSRYQSVDVTAGLNSLNGFQKWSLNSSTCDACEIKIVPLNPYLLTNDVFRFLETLGQAKNELIQLYGIHGQEYNLLAQMAVGILGRETKFFESTKYRIKEKIPGLVSLSKSIVAFVKNKETNSNSRGPTQIKTIPKKIHDRYGFETDQLANPRNAALATMGFLINALQELKLQVRVKKLTYITQDKIVDYLPYIYFGSWKAIYNQTATPETNLYIKAMKKYMSWVQVYEYNPYRCDTDPVVK